MWRPGWVAAAILTACGGSAQPPRGPAHTPVNSPEAKTACPGEWQAAKEAREALLVESGSPGAEEQAKAARAVFAHGECEQRVFVEGKVEAGSQEMMAAGLRAARRQFQAAKNLYQEAGKYRDQAMRVGAFARTAALDLAFARKLTELAPPADVADAVGQAEFRAAMREAAAAFEVEAVIAATQALDAAGRADAHGETGVWVRASCEVLAGLDPEAAGRYAECAR